MEAIVGEIENDAEFVTQCWPQRVILLWPIRELILNLYAVRGCFPFQRWAAGGAIQTAARLISSESQRVLTIIRMIGGLLLTSDYYEIGKMVKQAALRCKGGCFGILEGGYNHQVLGNSVRALLEGLSGDL